jgi:ABC-2 type transport system ATP-binding protein
MSAFENMKAQTYLLGIRDNNKIRQILKIVGLSEQSAKHVSNFSLGMAQRLKLGMALLESPDILILDEPANGLDPDGIVELREMLISLNRSNGITILISSHILSELGQLVTSLGILHDGIIVKEVFDQETLQDRASLENLYMAYSRGGNTCG